MLQPRRADRAAAAARRFRQRRVRRDFRRYTATIGRQFSIGPPTPRMRELYDLVRRASDAMIAAIRAGVPAVVPHEAAKRVIAEAGLDHGRVHTSGYGLGARLPADLGRADAHVRRQRRTRLQAGMVVTVEPPVFLGEERLGARIIDNVLVTARRRASCCRGSAGI